MDLSRQSPAPTRYVGIGLVVALHLAGIYALSAGLIKPPARHQESTILLPPVVDKQPEPLRPLETYKPEKPSVIHVPVPDVPVPPDWINAPVISSQPIAGDPAPIVAGPVAAAGPVAPAQPARPDNVMRTPGAVCSVMPRPDVPVVSWSGEAVLQVVATVRGGHVVGSEMRVASGALDAKTRRALQRSVESALAGYQCLGDATFQQDFAFRLD